MNHALRANEGYTLLELVVCVALLAVVINLAAAGFLNQHRLNLAGVEALDRIGEMDRLSRDVRELIRSAGAVLPEGAGWNTSEESLVLALPPENEGDARIAVLGLLEPEDRFGWMILEDGAAVRAASYRLDFERVRVSLDADEWRDVRQVTLELTPVYVFGEKREPVPRYVTGALRNDVSGDE